jgi:hypothetical protein
LLKQKILSKTSHTLKGKNMRQSTASSKETKSNVTANYSIQPIFSQHYQNMIYRFQKDIV